MDNYLSMDHVLKFGAVPKLEVRTRSSNGVARAGVYRKKLVDPQVIISDRTGAGLLEVGSIES